MFQEGPSGFQGGLSADNYLKITGTSRATATRDLQDLVEKGALSRTGERRHTRYWLILSETTTSQLSAKPERTQIELNKELDLKSP
jgi:DNA-binding IclR family transcriptional regulator